MYVVCVPGFCGWIVSVCFFMVVFMLGFWGVSYIMVSWSGSVKYWFRLSVLVWFGLSVMFGIFCVCFGGWFCFVVVVVVVMVIVVIVRVVFGSGCMVSVGWFVGGIWHVCVQRSENS